MRAIHVAAAAALLVAGCSTSPATTTDRPAELSREQAIALARGIDPCALVDRDALLSLGARTGIGTADQSTTCEATIDATSVRWSIILRPNDFYTSPQGSVEQFDGAAVRKADAAAALPAAQQYLLVKSSCTYTVALENSLAVRMSITADRDRNACEDGQPLINSVVTNWAKHPRQGTSPNTVVTVLTTATPCAAVEQLRQSHTVSFDWAKQDLNTCTFTVDGVDVQLGFDYSNPTALAAQTARFGDHDGHIDTSQATTTAQVVVGNQFTGITNTKSSTLVPTVTVAGNHAPTVTQVMTAALGQIPR